MVDINIELQKSLSITDPDMNKALHLLEEFKHLSVSKLMFKKQPQIMETIRWGSNHWMYMKFSIIFEI